MTLADRIDFLQLLAKIKMLTGVVEVGLFCHMIKAAYFGNQVRSILVPCRVLWLTHVLS